MPHWTGTLMLVGLLAGCWTPAYTVQAADLARLDREPAMNSMRALRSDGEAVTLRREKVQLETAQMVPGQPAVRRVRTSGWNSMSYAGVILACLGVPLVGLAAGLGYYGVGDDHVTAGFFAMSPLSILGGSSIIVSSVLLPLSASRRSQELSPEEAQDPRVALLP